MNNKTHIVFLYFVCVLSFAYTHYISTKLETLNETTGARTQQALDKAIASESHAAEAYMHAHDSHNRIDKVIKAIDATNRSVEFIGDHCFKR